MEQANTAEEIYSLCSSYAQLLKHVHLPAVLKLVNSIRSYKSRRANTPNAIATLEDAFRQHSAQLGIEQPPLQTTAPSSPAVAVGAPFASVVVAAVLTGPRLPPSNAVSSRSAATVKPRRQKRCPLSLPTTYPNSPLPTITSPLLSTSTVPLDAVLWSGSITELQRQVAALQQLWSLAFPSSSSPSSSSSNAQHRKRTAEEKEEESTSEYGGNASERELKEKKEEGYSEGRKRARSDTAFTDELPDRDSEQSARQAALLQQQCDEVNSQLSRANDELRRIQQQYDDAAQALRQEQDTTLRLQQTVNQLTAQLVDQEEELSQTIKKVGDADTDHRGQLGRVHDELSKERQQSSTLQQQITSMEHDARTAQERSNALDNRNQELAVAVGRAKTEANTAMQRLERAVVQGYIMRVCDEFVRECPFYALPLSEVAEKMPKEKAAGVLTCLTDFMLFSPSTAAQYQNLGVGLDSTGSEVNRAYRKLSLLVHSDQLPTSIHGDRKGTACRCARPTCCVCVCVCVC